MTSPLPPRQSDAPTFLKVFYTTAFAIHVQLLSLREWIGGTDLGFVPRWSDDTPIDVATMLAALLAKQKAVHTDDTHFTLAELYTRATPSATPVFRAAVELTVEGTSVSTAWQKAVQLTLNGKDTEGFPVKLVQLDVPTGNDFAKRTLGDITAEVADIWDVFSDEIYGFSSWRNNKPGVLRSQTATLNEALRKSYRDA